MGGQRTFGARHAYRRTRTISRVTAVLLAWLAAHAWPVLPADAADAAPAGSDPIGHLDAAWSPDAGRLRMSGWAFDPDAPTSPVEIHVYIGGVAGSAHAEGHNLGPADVRRPDVNRVYPGIGADHGFDGEVTTARFGALPIHVYAVNVAGTPGGSRLLATRTITVDDPSPRGQLDTVDSPDAAQLRLRGWAVDPNAWTTGLRIRASVGAPLGAAGAEVHELGLATRVHPEAAQRYPVAGDRHGFDATVTSNRTGTQTVHVYATNAPGTPGTTTLLGERRVAIAAPTQRFTPVAPQRILDSRPGAGRVGPYSTPWGEGTVRDITAVGVAGVPADAAAVVVNLTATGTSTASHLTVWPAGEDRPTVSNLNWSPGWTIANTATVKVGAGGRLSIANGQGSVDVVVDVVGYYQRNRGAGFTALSPARVVDSRRDGPPVGPHRTPWDAGTTRTVQITGAAGVPADATAVVVTATATYTTAPSFLTVWPAGDARPLASSLNWQAGWSIPNTLTVKLGAGGAISVFNLAGRADVVLDVVGYFADGSGDAFEPISPARIQDSRPSSAVGAYATPWTRGVTRDAVVSTGRVPSYASAVALNATVTNTTANSHLTLWPTGRARPLASSLNWAPGWTIANAVTGAVGAGGKVSTYNHAGSVDVVIDANGWYG
jgi:hypothetical protein